MIKHGAMVLLVLWSVGCGVRSSREAAEVALPADSLATTLEVKVASGEVHLILHVTNPTRRAVRLEFPTGQRYDFLVRSGSAEVWRWSADRMFNQSVGTETVAAGRSLKYEAVWRPGSRSG